LKYHYQDIFDREPAFIDEIMKPLVRDFPKLKITMEHISTKESVEYVLSAPPNVKASITPQHLIFNRNHLLVGGIKPHLYCLPILKAEPHREALVGAATSGNPKFFLGTDSAPHTTDMKESACGCAGVFSAHCAVELYTQVFDKEGKLELLEDFCSSFGADHYGLPRSTETITLEKKSWRVPVSYEFATKTVTPLKAGEYLEWSIVGVSR
jgi:dihydroorotase